jgi:hypothetical protein
LSTITRILLFSAMLSGCSAYSDLARDVNNAVAEYSGTYMAPPLQPVYVKRQCTDDRCRKLDYFEYELYTLVDRKRETYSEMVRKYYELRTRLYPDSRDTRQLYELRSFQRALAEQIDKGEVSATQWEYQNRKMASDMAARDSSRTKR